MHEDLLGYLLGALEPHEMRRVAQWLREDPEARRQLQEIERSLKPLEESFEPVESPPPDLVARTLASLPPLPQPGRPHEPQPETEAAASPAPVTLAPMKDAVEAPRDSAIGWLDWIGGVAAAVVVLGLILPALAEGRFESRKIACQDQLRQLGTAITQYVNRNQEERLPLVAASGPEAYAGIYSNRLFDNGLMLDPGLRWCPSLEPPRQAEFTLANVNEVVSVSELHEAPVDRLQQIQQLSGGHYAYTLGVLEDDQHASPRFEARSSFAVMSDAPQLSLTGDNNFQLVSHGGDGINVLYEDGRVRFVRQQELNAMRDHPWLNHRGSVEAGVNVDDAALAPSSRPPFVAVPQR